MATRQTQVIPQTICGFNIVRKVGEGSFGTVFLGKHQTTDGYVAIKAAKRSNDSKVMASSNKMIKAEASILSQLSHKNIVKLYSVLEDQGVDCMVLEFISGIDLNKLLASGKSSLTDKEASSIIRFILEGLDYLHSKSIVHRDIKPSNFGS